VPDNNSITSSARATNAVGISRPSALTFFRLTIGWNLSGGGPLIISKKGHSHRFGVAPAMSGLLLPVVQVFETRKEAEA